MRPFILTLVIALVATDASAQLERRPITLSAGLEMGFPMGEFNETWGREITGVSGNLTMPMAVLPFDLGIDFGWGRMGGGTKEIVIDDQYLGANTGDLRIYSDIFGYHGLLRLKPFNGKVSPYIEGLIGTRQFTTRTRVLVDGMDEPYMEQRNSNEFIWSHGWAAGIQIAPGRMFYFEARVERLNGGAVEYVDPSTITISDQGEVDYGTLTSGSRVINFHLGAGLRF